jgi:glycerol-3-phosphate dehydrogenase
VRIEREPAALAGSFDVVVIGGGITGVCVARESAGRGLRTLLVEKGDFGQGTSSATSKYIHGGIRYLETYEFGVVRESLRERRILGLAAPHLVSPTRFVMPAWKWSKPGAVLIGAGVGLYDVLSYDKNKNAPKSLRMPHPSWVSKKRLLREVPWLNPSDLHGAWAYPDLLNVHPERLLLALLQTAVQAGAVAMNHVRATGFLTDATTDGGLAVRGVTVEDTLTGEQHTVPAKVVVNCGGPWMDLVLASFPKRLGVGIQRSKGVHLLTKALGGTDAVFVRAPDGHHAIVSPWQGYSFIGPTDTAITDHPDDVAANGDDVNLILSTVNATSTTKLTVDDVAATTVGIRPLIVEDGKDSYSTSRRAELYDHAKAGAANLWSIGGGKWTTARGLAEDTINTLLGSDALKGAPGRSFPSRSIAVFGAFGWATDAQPFLEEAARSRSELAVDPQARLHLARLYGTEHDRILDLVAAEPALGRRISDRPGCFDIRAQIVFAVTHEAACTLGDVVHRRLVIGTLDPMTDAELEDVASVMTPLRGWSADEREAEVGRERDRRDRMRSAILDAKR